MTTPILNAERRQVTPVAACRPASMIACLLIGDVLTLAASGMFAILLKLIPSNHLASWNSYLRLVPLLPVFLLVYAAMGLYSGISMGSPEELRRLTLSSILVSLFLSVLTMSLRGTGILFTWTMTQALVLSVILVPLTRVCVRMRLSRVCWWGYPTVVLGDPTSVEEIIRNLLSEPGLGLKPVAFWTSSPVCSDVCGVPAIASAELGDVVRSLPGPAYAVLAPSADCREHLMSLIESYRPFFSHILIVPGLTRFSCLWVTPKNVGGLLGLEVCQQVFLPSRQYLKRLIDLVLTLIIAIIFAPVVLLICIAIALDSHGPVFYPHRRIGRGGREFYAWKFRSMTANADKILRQYLEENPEAADEWARTQKLRNDPRVTRVGRFLRRSSLDELPQLWNVIRGEMSLVGPRPIVREEIRHYGSDFETYTWVPGGLTGLWQVSGRSDTSYKQRVDYDRFYVYNWSVWLDFCILFRTIGTVLSRAGAF